MKLITEYLHQSISNHFSNINIPNTNPFFSPLSRTFLSTLFQKIHNANLEWFHQRIPIEDHWNNYSQTSDYGYIPEPIRKNWIEIIPKDTIIKRQATLYIGDRTFHIFLWFPTIHRNVNPPTIMSETEIEHKVQTTIRRIFMWLTIANTFLLKPTKCSKTVNIYLYLTHHCKFLPTNTKKPIDQICANTAFTTGCIQEQTNIHIFREEEWFKTFIHETFHTLGMDFIDLDRPEINQKILQLFPISVQDIRLYECYTEMCATMMNILFIVYLKDPPAKKGRLPLVKWISAAEDRFRMEQYFALFQAQKILGYHRLKYADLFSLEKAQMYRENTNVFSYYVLKCIWILNLNSFIEFCAKQPGGSSLKFHLTDRNLEHFIQLLKQLAVSKPVVDIFRELPVVPKKNNFTNTTLRMTLHEME
jgi:hypothetical protein